MQIIPNSTDNESIRKTADHTSQLVSSIEKLNSTIEENNKKTDEYNFWMKKATDVLIVISLIQAGTAVVQLTFQKNLFLDAMAILLYFALLIALIHLRKTAAAR